MIDKETDVHYQLISKFYFGKIAHRSKQSYMRHIDQGLQILDLYSELCGILYPDVVYQAFCIHPLVQLDNDLQNAYLYRILERCKPTVVLLAMEYRRVANSFLLKNLGSEIELGPLRDVRILLVADKIQNKRDLLLFNQQHERFADYVEYFDTWFEALGVTKVQYEKISRKLD